MPEAPASYFATGLVAPNQPDVTGRRGGMFIRLGWALKEPMHYFASRGTAVARATVPSRSRLAPTRDMSLGSRSADGLRRLHLDAPGPRPLGLRQPRHGSRACYCPFTLA